ncbi:MAG: thiopurine S-methyltransferase [Deltaproteobacteria bacterium]|nr:thiopurine S-methyltransferase [Deltaproteobacteria bacterium]
MNEPVAWDHFWGERWREGSIGFHEGTPNTLLSAHSPHLGANRRVLVPLCGKSEDLAFLAAHGHSVVGIELVEGAVKAFFAEHAISPTVMKHAQHVEYEHGPIQIFAGDYFATSPGLLGPLDALYDRAALVALPPELRARYAAHTRSLLAPSSPALIVTLEYDQALVSGPPFSVREDEVRTIYAPRAMRQVEEREDTRRPERGPTTERCWAIDL